MRIGIRRVIGAVCVLVAAGAIFAAAEPTKPHPNHDEQLSALMLAKLASSQKMLEGLVSEDFEQIRRGAEELNRICDATEWAGQNDPIYAHHRTELRRQGQKLVKLADDRNFDGTVYTYVNSLTTCISCHKYCRDVLKIADDVPPMDKVVPIPVTEDVPLPFGSRPVRR